MQAAMDSRAEALQAAVCTLPTADRHDLRLTSDSADTDAAAVAGGQIRGMPVCSNIRWGSSCHTPTRPNTLLSGPQLRDMHTVQDIPSHPFTTALF